MNEKIENIEKIKIEDDESLLISVKLDEMNEEEAYAFLKSTKAYFSKKFPNTNIVVVPSNISVKNIKIKE